MIDHFIFIVIKIITKEQNIALLTVKFSTLVV